ncbi:GtrA family protein [Mycobacterium paragordonae]|uniref:GtrA family protein n=1 Tax=Mycobacterium paragordonae TaxID=1389713 RepID=UPI00241303CC|nr:GtrA family protein [Mycobacterium paragordonae]
MDDYVTASVLAASIATVPNFLANRCLVWRVASRDQVHRQAVVFWLAVMAGVTLATVFTYFVEKHVDGQVTLVRGAAVLSAQLLGFGLVWIGRFVMLDRWLFKHATQRLARDPTLPSELPT